MSQPEKITLINNRNTQESRESHFDEIINNITSLNIEFNLGQAFGILLFIFRASYLNFSPPKNTISRASLPLSLFASLLGVATVVFGRLALVGVPNNQNTLDSLSIRKEYNYPDKENLQAILYLEIDSNEDGSTKYYSDKECSIIFDDSQNIDTRNSTYNMITNSINNLDVSDSIKIRLLESSKTLDVNLEIKDINDKRFAVAINKYNIIKEINSVDEIIMEEVVETNIYEIFDADEKVIGLKKDTLSRYFKLKKNTNINDIYLVISGNNLVDKKNNNANLTNNDNDAFFIKDEKDELGDIDNYNNIYYIKEQLYDKNKSDKKYFKVKTSDFSDQINPLNVSLDYGNPARRIQLVFYSVLIPFTFINSRLRRSIFRMKYNIFA